MRRTLTFPIVALIFSLFFWLNLPKAAVDAIRVLAVSPFYYEPLQEVPIASKLLLENQRLKAQLEQAYDWLLSEKRMQELFELVKEKPLEQRNAHLLEALKAQSQSIAAQVIYRDPGSWSSSLWVNVGEETNKALSKTVVAKNSPVLSHGALVGVVDYVGAKQSRIRLITDSAVSPAVCTAPGASREVSRQIEELCATLEKRGDLFANEQGKQQLLAQLALVKSKNALVWEDGYLAKGEVHGSSAPFWRSRSPILKGVGFHFDDADRLKGGISLLKEGDMIVTSGLDGVFPAGLKVGTIYRVETPREGSYMYDLLVRPFASHLNDLKTLYILPPQES